MRPAFGGYAGWPRTDPFVRERTERGFKKFQHRHMEAIQSVTGKQIHPALASWAAAVEAVLQEIHHTANGGQSDPAAMGKLLAAVEAARQLCEEAQSL